MDAAPLDGGPHRLGSLTHFETFFFFLDSLIDFDSDIYDLQCAVKKAFYAGHKINRYSKKEIVALDNDMGAFRCLKCNYEQRQPKDMWQMRKV